ncbi:hypothetical protein HAX54_017411 [Datura stramonium]|uniref:Uncharacterized protein n=1 Tax=Datura stramonium TaxID=4076 RepID=A0ABS8UMX9_DATST|nr:hypothetical protein [Datura stramonium]
MRDEALIPAFHHYGDPVPFDATSKAPLVDLALQEGNTFTKAPGPIPTSPSRTISTSKVSSGIVLLTYKTFASMVARLEIVERQQVGLIDELPNFISKSIEKALQPLRDFLLITQ